MLKTILSLALTLIVGSLKALLLRHVESLNALTLTNEEKRGRAISLFRNDAKISGKALRDSLINLAIEIAVSLLKK